jgi:class 3 adenylate cyclase/tetratricopeptide (TPR) repeat protein
MRCPRCQHENSPDALFCQECGVRLDLPCPGCGTGNQPGAKFCKRCGQGLAPATGGQPGPAQPSPATYTPKHLAERILTSKAALEGERKQVTVLFADLKGSMELLADRDPEEARKILDPVLERMMEAVHRYEGTVNQVMGDGIMALFGAPLAHEDHAVRACYTALRMHEVVGRYADELRRTQGLDAQIRVGVNSGEVVVRSIGSDLRMDYTAVGQTAHLAARMEQLARPGTTLVTPDTLRLAEGYVQAVSLGPMPVKGLTGPVEVYEVTGAGPVRSRLQAAAVRGLTRFIGRDTELEALHQALERARTGHGQVVAVVGEPGVGKSRLFWEFTHSERFAQASGDTRPSDSRRRWLALETSSASYGKATPYLPVIDLLRAYFQIEGRDDARRIREKVTGKLLSLDRALEPCLPAILSLLDLPVDDPSWQRLDPPGRRQAILDGVRRLLLRESQTQPLLVVFEDLHWIDGETQALLDGLIESLPTARLLLLVNYRPEYQHAWGSKTYYRQLGIDPLPPESAEELLRLLLGHDNSLEPLKRLLIGRTEGNPFFLEESVRTLVETKVLAGERGAHRLETMPHSLEIPATVQALLAARIDRLEPDDKRLLQAAAVIGENAPLSLLEAIADQSEEGLCRSLTRLQAAEFLYETLLFPDLEFTFKHGLTQNVAYASLLHERRRVLHARTVEAIERIYADRLAEQAERLAHHAFNAEIWGKALAYLRQAGTKAATRSAYREAAGYFERALAALARLPESRETTEQGIDLRLDLRNSLHAIGEFPRTIEPLREAGRLAEGLGDRLRLGRVATSLCQYYRQIDDLEEAVKLGQRALTVATTVGDFVLKLLSNIALGQAYHAFGDYPRAIDCLRNNMSALGGDLVHERFGFVGLPSVFSLSWLARCLAELGEFSDAIAEGERGVRIAEEVDHPFSLVTAYYGAGVVHLRKGDLETATRRLERGVGLCSVWNFRSWFPPIASALGTVYTLSGRFIEALPVLEQAVEQAASMGLMGRQSLRLAALSEGYQAVGRQQNALDLAAQALDLSRRYKERGREAWNLRLLGDIISATDSPHFERAGDCYRQALALAGELGMRPLVAHCHLGLGKLSQRMGQREQARDHLTIATTMYREMGMAYWLEQAGAELKDLA